MNERGISPAGALVFTISYTKTRDCRLASTEWFGIDEAGVFYFAYVTDPNGRPIRPSLRLEGRNLSRLYHLYLTDESIKFFVVLSYRCGLPWTSRQTLGPFDRWFPMPEANPVPR